MQEISIITQDGTSIISHLFEPQNSNNKILLINSATGVKQHIYFAFAQFFAKQGFTVLTYDYRGIGLSKPKKMKGSQGSMRIWGTQDFAAMTDFIKEKYPNYLKYCVGHSVGALILGMNNDAAIFDEFIFVATQDAYFRNLNFKVGFTAVLGFGIALPFTTSLLGYFPANWFGLGESLPKGSAFDWRTLILNKKSTSKLFEKIENDYSKQLSQKVYIIYAEDDPWVTMKGMESLMNNAYPNMRKTYHEVKTSESEKKDIGHINFFRNYNKNLWQIVLQELN